METDAAHVTLQVQQRRRENEKLAEKIEGTAKSVKLKLKEQATLMAELAAKVNSASSELSGLKQHLLLPGCSHQVRVMDFAEKLIAIDSTNPAELCTFVRTHVPPLLSAANFVTLNVYASLTLLDRSGASLLLISDSSLSSSHPCPLPQSDLSSLLSEAVSTKRLVRRLYSTLTPPLDCIAVPVFTNLHEVSGVVSCISAVERDRAPARRSSSSGVLRFSASDELTLWCASSLLSLGVGMSSLALQRARHAVSDDVKLARTKTSVLSALAAAWHAAATTAADVLSNAEGGGGEAAEEAVCGYGRRIASACGAVSAKIFVRDRASPQLWCVLPGEDEGFGGIGGGSGFDHDEYDENAENDSAYVSSPSSPSRRYCAQTSPSKAPTIAAALHTTMASVVSSGKTASHTAGGFLYVCRPMKDCKNGGVVGVLQIKRREVAVRGGGDSGANGPALSDSDASAIESYLSSLLGTCIGKIRAVEERRRLERLEMSAQASALASEQAKIENSELDREAKEASEQAREATAGVKQAKLEKAKLEQRCEELQRIADAEAERRRKAEKMLVGVKKEAMAAVQAVRKSSAIKIDDMKRQVDSLSAEVEGLVRQNHALAKERDAELAAMQAVLREKDMLAAGLVRGIRERETGGRVGGGVGGKLAGEERVETEKNGKSDYGRDRENINGNKERDTRDMAREMSPTEASRVRAGETPKARREKSLSPVYLRFK